MPKNGQGHQQTRNGNQDIGINARRLLTGIANIATPTPNQLPRCAA
ncbi:hypothetical protein KCP71_09395 [Salmonella enterica subsp. enterica]|nr:hypothetical protein KCP71_09395 [Salmonella enterica subsp. enterica]